MTVAIIPAHTAPDDHEKYIGEAKDNKESAEMIASLLGILVTPETQMSDIGSDINILIHSDPDTSAVMYNEGGEDLGNRICSYLNHVTKMTDPLSTTSVYPLNLSHPSILVVLQKGTDKHVVCTAVAEAIKGYVNKAVVPATTSSESHAAATVDWNVQAESVVKRLIDKGILTQLVGDLNKPLPAGALLTILNRVVD